MTSIHKFKIEGLEGQEIDFATFKGKKIMVVNVASECGYTSQYQQLQELYEEFNHKLEIVGIPANDFGGQEPGTNSEIQTFCKRNYGVSFPMAAKVTVLGEQAHPIYKWLTNKTQNGVIDSEVKWNFNKFLLDEEGYLVSYHPSSVSPIDESILNWLMN